MFERHVPSREIYVDENSFKTPTSRKIGRDTVSTKSRRAALGDLTNKNKNRNKKQQPLSPSKNGDSTSKAPSRAKKTPRTRTIPTKNQTAILTDDTDVEYSFGSSEPRPYEENIDVHRILQPRTGLPNAAFISPPPSPLSKRPLRLPIEEPCLFEDDEAFGNDCDDFDLGLSLDKLDLDDVCLIADV